MDIIEEGINGHLVEVKDAKALADRVIRVLNLPEGDWKRMSDAALKTATRFSWDDATELFEKALEFAIVRRERGELQNTDLLPKGSPKTTLHHENKATLNSERGKGSEHQNGDLKRDNIRVA